MYICIHICIMICLMGQGVHIFCWPMSVARVTFEARKLRQVSSNYKRTLKIVLSCHIKSQIGAKFARICQVSNEFRNVQSSAEAFAAQRETKLHGAGPRFPLSPFSPFSPDAGVFIDCDFARSTSTWWFPKMGVPKKSPNAWFINAYTGKSY